MDNSVVGGMNRNNIKYTCPYALKNGDCSEYSNQIEINTRLREAIAFATGRLDSIPNTNEGKLCVEVREYLLNVLNEIKMNSKNKLLENKLYLKWETV